MKTASKNQCVRFIFMTKSSANIITECDAMNWSREAQQDKLLQAGQPGPCDQGSREKLKH